MSEPERKTVDQAARERVSIRRYTTKVITREEIDEILELAGKAPSPSNIQPWRFYVITGAELKQKMKAVSFNQHQVGENAFLIVLATDMVDALTVFPESVHPGVPSERKEQTIQRTRAQFVEMGEKERDQYGRAIGYIALGYLMLILEARGLGSSPMLGFDQEKVKELLGLASHVEIPAIIAVGEPAEEGFRPGHRQPTSVTVKYLD